MIINDSLEIALFHMKPGVSLWYENTDGIIGDPVLRS